MNTKKVSTKNELFARLISATSIEILAPIVRDKIVENLSLRESLQSDLSEPVIVTSAERKFQQFIIGNELAAIIPELIRSQPALRDVSIELFLKEVSPTLQELQGAFLESCFLAVTLLSHGNNDFEANLDDLIRIAASATPAGQLMRELLTDFTHKPNPLAPPKGGLPGLPGISEQLLMKAEIFRKRGCVGAVKSAMRRWGTEMRNATPNYLKDVIDSLDPVDNCPGDVMVIHGHGLGNGTNSAVVFTRKGGGVILVPPNSIMEWVDDHITLTIPIGSIRGPIGILLFSGNGGDFASAAADAVTEIGGCFGPEVVMRLERVLNKLSLPPISTPSVQANGANMYRGGPPIIDYFTISPVGYLFPGKTIRLSWSIIGADQIEIVARNVVGSALQELPAITGKLPYTSGSVSVTVPASHPWKGQYVIRAKNKCTGSGAEEATTELEMVLRRGLALGGGGSRGDFQVGALLYLYNEKNYRPDAISATSVGSINAIELVMGDDAPTSSTPARSAASRLSTTWLSFQDETQMWDEEAWLKNSKAQVRQIIHSLSIEGLILLPYTVTTGAINVSELKDLFDNPRKKGVVSIFNINPIETLARAQYQQLRTNASGIKLRLVAVSLETGELVMVDESGGILQRGPQPIRPASVPVANTTGVIDGAIASATMPGIFPARRLGDHMCVDGGVKEVIPVQVAVHDLGCNDVTAIRCSARTALSDTDPTRPVGTVIARSVMELTYDAIADDDIAPFSGWGTGVSVSVIQPSFNLHDPMVIEPGLIRIAIDYGWMRAADSLDVDEGNRRYAKELSDKITRLRFQNWMLEHEAAGIRIPDPFRGFTHFLLNGIVPQSNTGYQQAKDPIAVDSIRANCRIIREALSQRLQINAPTPASSIRTTWFTQWEMIDVPPASHDPWDSFFSTLGNRQAETPPAPI